MAEGSVLSSHCVGEAFLSPEQGRFRLKHLEKIPFQIIKEYLWFKNESKEPFLFALDSMQTRAKENPLLV